MLDNLKIFQSQLDFYTKKSTEMTLAIIEQTELLIETKSMIQSEYLRMLDKTIGQKLPMYAIPYYNKEDRDNAMDTDQYLYYMVVSKYPMGVVIHQLNDDKVLSVGYKNQSYSFFTNQSYFVKFYLIIYINKIYNIKLKYIIYLKICFSDEMLLWQINKIHQW